MFPDTTKMVEKVLDKLQQHFRGRSNNGLCRRRFSSCKQIEGESFDDFHLHLKSLAKEVDLCTACYQQCEEVGMKYDIITRLGRKARSTSHRHSLRLHPSGHINVLPGIIMRPSGRCLRPKGTARCGQRCLIQHAGDTDCPQIKSDIYPTPLLPDLACGRGQHGS